MPLDLDKIKALQAIKNKPKRRPTRKRKGPDLTTIESRTLETWFSLQHKFQAEDEEGNISMLRCESPDCRDPRNPEKGGIRVVEINGRHICRYCFLDGWLVVDEDQIEIEGEARDVA